ncbi:type II toxin-antitoxin system RelE/ParE family toxin [Halomonas sp. AOP27-A1-41]|uniref:type II toxin-antitoxin system RelE/ParE family toxin n=1 Tax=Halomonas sp. AOP27-A1-41 TaxID=3457707 RepID=UPI0040348880
MPPTYSGKACTGVTLRNAFLCAAPLTSKDKRLAPSGGDAKAVGDGVLELRIDYGPGYRVYYAKVGRRLVMLLAGGTKKRQQADIEQAKAFLADHRRRAST